MIGLKSCYVFTIFNNINNTIVIMMMIIENILCSESLSQRAQLYFNVGCGVDACSIAAAIA